MAEKVFNTPRLSSSDVIEAIAYSCDPADFVELGAVVDVDINGWSVLFKVTRTNEKTVQAFCDFLKLDCAALHTVPASEIKKSGRRRLGSEMLWHLIHRDWMDEQDAVPKQGEKLVIAPGMQGEKLFSLLDRLNTHTTCCRAAQFEPETGDTFTLFHLRDDPARGSTLRPFFSAYSGKVASVLSAYHTEYGTVFLPKAPPRDALSAVAYIADRAPKLFGFRQGTQEGWSSSRLLFAIGAGADFAGSAKARPDLSFDIRRARFFGSHAFRKKDRPAMVVANPVTDPEREIEKLKRVFSDPNMQFAHPLRLREDKSHLLTLQESAAIARLEAEKKAIDQRLRHAKADLEQQAVVGRATDAAFPAFMRILREVVAQTGNWDGIKYRVDRQGDEGERRHVFYFSPERSGNLNVYARLNTVAGIEWFRGDPNWTLLYGRHARIKLMVPWNTALHPLPHSWDADQIDAYLVKMVGLWSDEKIKLSDGGDHVLLFRHHVSGQRNKVALDVYDAAGFGQLEGETITWFNAMQVHLADPADREGIIAQAEAANDQGLGQKRGNQSQEIKELLERQEQQMKDFGEKSVERIFESVEAEIEKLASQMNSRVKKIKAFEDQVKLIEKNYSSAKRSLEAFQSRDEKFTSKIERESGADMHKMTQFASRLQEREDKFNQLMKRTTDHVQAMRKSLAELRKGLF